MKYFLLAIVIALSGCSSKDEYILFNKATPLKSKKITTTLKNVNFEYKIQPHDRVSIIIYKHPELSSVNPSLAQIERGLLIDSKGDIRLPLIKNIHLASFSQPEAEAALTEAYRVYLKKPDIHLEVINKRAYVIGEVKSPGKITLDNEQLPLLQILARAGDLTDQANRNSILVMRKTDNSEVTSTIVSLTDIHSIISANIMIKPNDIVYVMPNGMKAFNTKVNEISPVFRLISSILQPFVNIKFLSN